MKRYSPLILIVLLLAAPVFAQEEDDDIYASLRTAASRQPSFDGLKTSLAARVTDRRFYTREAMYLANEMNESGDPFLSLAESAGLPVGSDLDFQYITGVESYWYSRYNMQSLITESRLGLGLVHGPYVTEKALRIGNAQYNRDRGEDELSNKAVLLQHLVPSYLAASGLPRRFEDASPLMLEFASGDPHLLRPVDHREDFDLAENEWRHRQLKALYGDSYEPPSRLAGEGGNDVFRYRIGYRDSFETLRWSNDRMDHSVDMGGVGQTLMKAVLWMEYFFRQTHHGDYLGVDAEDGFRGAILNLASVSKMLLLKSSLLYDGKRLGGVNPFDYDPARGFRYFPHRVSVKTRYIGDLPPRPEGFKVTDKDSHLFDQASLLWGLSEFFYFADPNRPRRGPYYDLAYPTWNRVFGDDTPYDGSLMEAKYLQLARGLANLVLRNMEAMHVDAASGLLQSKWSPDGKSDKSASVQDLAMSILALSSYHRYLAGAEPELAARAAALLKRQADFLAEAAGGEAVAESYAVDSGKAGGERGTLMAEAFAVRGLLAAYADSGEPRYLEAARKAYGFMTGRLWDEATGVFRSSLGAETSVYTPMVVGATLGAMREFVLVSRDEAEYQRFKRFWVQAVNSSGLQQAEYEETGDDDYNQVDSDGDGIPRIEAGGGRHGIAPVYAGRVEIETPLPVITDGGR